MKYLLFDVLFLFGIGLSLSLDLNCPPINTKSQCQCSIGFGKTVIQCYSLTDTESLYKEIQNLKGYPIDDLKLNDVQLPYLPAGLFSGTTIKRLHILSSRLDNLYSVNNSTPSPFEGLENTLEEIHVEYTNSPDKWYWPNLKNFKQMKKFEFQHSPISFIGHVFAEIGNGSLEVITASHSRVNRIHPQGFTELVNLREANFDSNNLPYLVRTMFPNPANRLEKLNFRDNKIFTLNENMFENMPQLKYLDLSQNELISFSKFTFIPIWNNFKSLKLSGNPYQCECNLLLLKERMLGHTVPGDNDFEDITCLYKGSYKKTKLRDVQGINQDVCLW